MKARTRGTVYIIISAVKDEEKYIEDTIGSVVGQTIRPYKWIIVDDGSRDRTPDIIFEYTKRHEWVELVRIMRGGGRRPGPGVINAFNKGYEVVENLNFDFIVKLDCDLRLSQDYFEQLFLRFSEEERLGIASGVYVERNGQKWNSVRMPDYHACGASKVIRKECFREIKGFVPCKGWDTLDEIRAQMLGWKTCHFTELKIYHLKNEGSGLGNLRTSAMLGEIYYLLGGSRLFFAMKVLHRIIFGRPRIIGGVAMVFGYLKPLVLRKELLATRGEADFYRSILHRRMLAKIVNAPFFKIMNLRRVGLR
jgi:glycosyltransferase involved in cell wall biosynthesis